jgi:hypothetical protein
MWEMWVGMPKTKTEGRRSEKNNLNEWRGDPAERRPRECPHQLP